MATTTNYGWETPDDTDLVKVGALAIRTSLNAVDSTLGTALNNKLHAGLVLIKTQTVGTGVSSVSVTNAFSTTYDGYKITYTGGVGSTTIELGFGLNGISTGHYSDLIYGTFASNGAASSVNGGATSYFRYCGTATTYDTQMELEIFNPFLSRRKWGKGLFSPLTSNGNGGFTHFFIDSTTSATGFTINCPTGNITGGTIAVYGYAKD